MASARMKELVKKYGKVGLAVHCSISAASTAALYTAIKNNVDVQSIFTKFGLKGLESDQNTLPTTTNVDQDGTKKSPMNRTAEIAGSSGGVAALALLCNKALFPVRVPITLLLTPPIARFLARRKLIKNPTL